jgi:hypothetical protein
LEVHVDEDKGPGILGQHLVEQDVAPGLAERGADRHGEEASRAGVNDIRRHPVKVEHGQEDVLHL